MSSSNVQVVLECSSKRYLAHVCWSDMPDKKVYTPQGFNSVPKLDVWKEKILHLGKKNVPKPWHWLDEPPIWEAQKFSLFLQKRTVSSHMLFQPYKVKMRVFKDESAMILAWNRRVVRMNTTVKVAPGEGEGDWWLVVGGGWTKKVVYNPVIYNISWQFGLNFLFLLVVWLPKRLTAILSSRTSGQADTRVIYEGVSRAFGSDRYPGKRSKVIYVRFSIRPFFKPYFKQEQRAGHAVLLTSDLLRETLRSKVCKTVAGQRLSTLSLRQQHDQIRQCDQTAMLLDTISSGLCSNTSNLFIC